MSNREFREIIDDVFAPSGLGNRPNSPSHEGKGKKHADYLVKMVQEGGASLTNFLLSAAVSSAEAKEKIPDVTKVHGWHFRDLMRLPKAAQEEWKIACKEELEALRATSLSLPTYQRVVKPLAVDGSSTSNQTVVRRPGL
jgi:hypothetical protein